MRATRLVSFFLLCLAACSGSRATPAMRLEIAAGDGQTGQILAPVAVAPQVRVRDGAGVPVAGVEVVFAVVDGGGAVERAQASTDADGYASCGAWTLGPSPGIQKLSASIVAGASVGFQATAALRTAMGLVVNITAPVANGRVTPDIEVHARIESVYELVSVKATLGVEPVDLLPSGGGEWVGNLSAATLASGPIYVIVTATDVFGNVSDGIAWATLDRLPVITVESPGPQALAYMGALHVAATCHDDNPAGCSSLILRVWNVSAQRFDILLTGTDRIAGDVDLSAFDGKEVRLLFDAVDSSSLRTEVQAGVTVQMSGALRPVALAPGQVLDYSAGRILFINEEDAFQISDIDTGATEVVEAGPHPCPGGVLTPAGAVYFFNVDCGRAGSAPRYREWRSGVSTELSPRGWGLAVSGKFALFSDGSLLPSNIQLRDTTAGETAVVNMSRDLSFEFAREGSVTDDGGVVFSVNDWTHDSNTIYRWRDGVMTGLTDGGRNFGAITDGINVVYSRGHPDYAREVLLRDGAGNVMSLVANMTYAASYAISNGWVAYAQPNASSGPVQVWRYSAETGRERITYFAADSTVEAIGPDGTIVLQAGNRRYRAVPGAAPQDIGSVGGKLVFRDGKFYVLLGAYVFEVGPG